MPAEGLRDRSNESDFPGSAVCKSVFPGRFATVVRDLLQRAPRMDAPVDFSCRHHKTTIPVAVRVERHEFDEAHDDAALAGEAGKRFHLVIVNAADEYRIDLG